MRKPGTRAGVNTRRSRPSSSWPRRLAGAPRVATGLTRAAKKRVAESASRAGVLLQLNFGLVLPYVECRVGVETRYALARDEWKTSSMGAIASGELRAKP